MHTPKAHLHDDAVGGPSEGETFAPDLHDIRHLWLKAVLFAVWVAVSFGACYYARDLDRKSTRLNSSPSQISYAVFCLKKKKKTPTQARPHRAREPARTARPASLGARRATVHTPLHRSRPPACICRSPTPSARPERISAAS